MSSASHHFPNSSRATTANLESPRRINEIHYVVTGGAGFIGSNTVDELVRRGHQVTVFDDPSAGKMENLAGYLTVVGFNP